MAVPLLDLQAQYRSIRQEVLDAVSGVLDAQRFILGPEVEGLEAEVARYCQTAHAVGMSSGTDALLAVLMAEGIGPGDEVITTPFSFFATVGAIERVGATTVLVDIDLDTCNLDVARIEAAITRRTKAIMPVHLYGQMADMVALMQIAKRHGLLVIEDAAQAIGAEQTIAGAGRRAGSIGDYGCLSFFPSKNLGAAGDGGMVLCQDEARAEKLRLIRNHGAKVRYHHTHVGGNFRLDALQAAVLRVKLHHLEGWTEGRRRNAARYRELLIERGAAVSRASELDADRDARIALPFAASDRRHVYNQFVVRTQRRDALRKQLEARGIGHEVYYPVPFHRQACFERWALGPGSFPQAERAASEALALPIYPELTDAQLIEVADALTS
jgi:dTDP-4-amino-4,6-dideoxygalactose transaminase